jgi:hypothetical protein
MFGARGSLLFQQSGFFDIDSMTVTLHSLNIIAYSIARAGITADDLDYDKLLGWSRVFILPLPRFSSPTANLANGATNTFALHPPLTNPLCNNFRIADLYPKAPFFGSPTHPGYPFFPGIHYAV